MNDIKQYEGNSKNINREVLCSQFSYYLCLLFKKKKNLSDMLNLHTGIVGHLYSYQINSKEMTIHYIWDSLSNSHCMFSNKKILP